MAEMEPAIIEPSAENVRAWLIGHVARYLDEPAGAIDPNVPLPEYGLDSVYAFTLCAEIEDTLGVIVEPVLIWEAGNLTGLADHIAGLAARRSGGDR
jgi:acyl carrier protein